MQFEIGPEMDVGSTQLQVHIFDEKKPETPEKKDNKLIGEAKTPIIGILNG